MNKTAKSKRTAIMLAIFFGGGTYLYTYKKTGWDFWIIVGIFICLIGGTIWAHNEGKIESSESFMLAIALWALISWGGAIVDRIKTTDEWYKNYPV